MRVLFLGNNWVGWQIAASLKAEGEDIVGAVLHSPGRRQYGEQILSTLALDRAHIVDGGELSQSTTLDRIRALRPEIGVSALFGYLVPQPVLDLFPAGCLNIHPALLPYNRGAFPNVWSIIDRTPAGATIHYMDAGIDTGDIVAQREVLVEPVDTGETLYRKLERACVELFHETWPLVRAGTARRCPQPAGHGSQHRVKDAAAVDEVALDRTYVARDLIDLLRARTFPPHPGAFFRHEGRKVYLRLQLEYGDTPDAEQS